MDKLKSLPEIYTKILDQCGTENPFSGKYNNFYENGSYLCRRCGLALFRSSSKFNSHTGWPSFDDSIAGHVKSVKSETDSRTEIVCSRCQSHLGHVFMGEGFTPKNIRHCTNSLSLDFISSEDARDTQEAILAGGCFWGVEHLFSELEGVMFVESGYIGGASDYPSYNEVCTGESGHIEAVRIIFNPLLITYKQILKFFFEIHNPFQSNGQGVNIGLQYQSAIFYFDEEQQKLAQQVMALLEETENKRVATALYSMSIFWKAEEEHQEFFKKHPKVPNCHCRTKRFD